MNYLHKFLYILYVLNNLYKLIEQIKSIIYAVFMLKKCMVEFFDVPNISEEIQTINLKIYTILYEQLEF